MTSKTYEIISMSTFLEAYYASTNEERKILCGLYKHNIWLQHNLVWNPNHFVGDVQLNNMNNHIEW